MEYFWNEEDLAVFIQLDLFRSITQLFHHLLRREPSLPLILITILQMERATELLLLFCRKGEGGPAGETSRSFSRVSSSVDSSTCRSGFPPAVKSLIDSLMVFFFSTLELLASPPLLAFVAGRGEAHGARPAGAAALRRVRG